jgi:outer membrane biosynthesis protein TonB
MTVLFCSASLWTNAQTKPIAPAEKVYTYVEQMPQLPGGGGDKAIASQLMRLLRVPKLKEQLSWPRTKVSFIVGSDGRIYDEQVFLTDSIPEYSAAMLRAVRALPRFTPGYQEGKPVAVKITIPFSCIMIQ